MGQFNIIFEIEPLLKFIDYLIIINIFLRKIVLIILINNFLQVILEEIEIKFQTFNLLKIQKIFPTKI